MKRQCECGHKFKSHVFRGGCTLCDCTEHKERKLTQSEVNRKAREQAMRDMGLVRVRGALGGVYWE